MPTLPISMMSALILGFLFVRMWFFQKHRTTLALLLALCALQSLIISLAQHYMVPGMRPLQAIMATLIPPMAFIAFQTTAIRALQLKDAAHMLVPIVALGLWATGPSLLDIYIPALFVVYGLIILYLCAKGADALPQLRFVDADNPSKIWRIIAFTLMASAMSDVLIVLAQIFEVGHLKPYIIGIYSSGTLLLVGAFSLTGALQVDKIVPDIPSDKAVAEESEIMDQLSELMSKHKPYLDPDLSLSRLSKKLRVPAKQLSTAINRSTGENVSRYINRARIYEAQQALLRGENVTNTIFASGFNTKSNFNREFLRVTGVSPTDWLRTNSQVQ